jgi:Spy/CpxP family protein refolding chaperone
MRNSRVLALVVASLVSTASFAGAQAPATGQQGGRQTMGRGIEGRRGGPGDGALRGLNLSETEKAKVKEIRAKYVAEARTLSESLKPTMQEVRALRQKGDTAGLRALREKNKPVRDQLQALQRRQQADIRAALSAENQKLFDANVREQATRRAEWAKNGKAGKAGKAGKQGGAHRGNHGGRTG